MWWRQSKQLDQTQEDHQRQSQSQNAKLFNCDKMKWQTNNDHLWLRIKYKNRKHIMKNKLISLNIIQTILAFSSWLILMKFWSFFGGLGIGMKTLLLFGLTVSISFRDRSGVLITLSLLFLSSSWELFLRMIEGNLTLVIFSWLLLFDFTLDFLNRLFLF